MGLKSLELNIPELNILIMANELLEANKTKILLADGNTSIHKVYIAQSSDTALNILENHKIDIALIHCDLSNHGCARMVKSISKLNPDTTSIVITKNNNKDNIQKIYNLGCQNYLNKEQLSCENLERSITYSLERHYLINKLSIQESQLKQKNEELRKILKDKNNFLNFINFVSHEVRTPLSLVSGAAELLANTKLDTFQSKYVQSFQKASDHILDIVSDTLDINQIESGGYQVKKADFKLKTLALEVTELSEFACHKKGLAFNFNIDGAVDLNINTDYRALKQILLNVINNAVKFTEQGSVEIHCYYEPQAIYVKNKTLIFEIRDTGVGISDKDSETIFDKFIQCENNSYGNARSSGLGLHLSQELIHQLNGNIWVKSKNGAGSSFFISLKIEDNKQASVQALEEKQIKKLEYSYS